MTVREILEKDQAGAMVTIIGRITKILPIKMNQGRSLSLVDHNFESIEIVLWK